MSSIVPPDFESYVLKAVAAGQYSSPEAAVEEAFRLLRDRDRNIEQFRADVAAGFEQLDRGEGTEYDDVGLDALIDRIQLEHSRQINK